MTDNIPVNECPHSSGNCSKCMVARTPEPIESLDWILLHYGGWCCGQVEASDTDKQFHIAKAKLEAYITEQERLARGCVDCKTLRCESCERLWQS